MGGVKKRPISQSGKAQTLSGDTVEAAKEKKEKSKRSGGAERRVLFTARLDTEAAKEYFKVNKSITVYEMATKLSIPPSVVNAALRTYESEGLIRKVAGYSGHVVYTSVKG